MFDDNQPVYLRPNVLFEPLSNRWYVSCYLLSPPAAALTVADRHAKIMQSFVASPRTHMRALENPAMAGGPFIRYGEERVPEIRDLLERTKADQAELFAFAAAIRKAEQMLLSEAQGHSLTPLYARLPEPLRGRVELVYDVHHRPSLRFLEGLLQRDPLAELSMQSGVLSLVERDDRPFVLSTPRLPEPGDVEVPLPFRDPAYDALFAARSAPTTLGAMRETLAAANLDPSSLAGLFHAEAPPPRAPFANEGVRIRYFGHACVLLETAQTSVLCDPVISYRYESETPRYTLEDLPEVLDFVLITHNHIDHFLLETLLPLRSKARTIVVPKNRSGNLADPSLKLILRQNGFPNVVEIDELETLDAADGAITGIPFLGEHADLDIRGKSAYWVTLAGRQVLLIADSNNIDPPLYERLRQALGKPDLLFLGMECEGAPLNWLYGSFLGRPLAQAADRSRRLDGSDAERGLRMVDALEPDAVYVYAMGAEPWLAHLTSIHYTPQSKPIVESDKLTAECRRRGLESERLFGKKEILLPPRKG